MLKNSTKRIEFKNRISIDTIYSCFEKSFESLWVSPGEQHNFWELNYVVDGCVEIVKDDNVYELTGDEMIFFAPMAFHGIRSSKGTSPKIIVIAFEMQVQEYNNFFDGIFKIGEAEDKLIRKAISIYTNYSNYKDEIKNQFIANSLEQMLLMLIENHTPRIVMSKSKVTQNYRLIVTTLNENIPNNLSMEQIAELCGMSVSNLKKVFTRYTGRSVMRYYNSIRISKAKVMIRSGYNFIDICRELNYSSQYYFTDTFKRHVGMTPSQYKKTFYIKQ